MKISQQLTTWFYKLRASYYSTRTISREQGQVLTILMFVLWPVFFIEESLIKHYILFVFWMVSAIVYISIDIMKFGSLINKLFIGISLYYIIERLVKMITILLQ